MQNLCDRAADLAIQHTEAELGLQPRTFARKEKQLFPDTDRIISEYAQNRAFFITGIAKDEILTTVRNMITEYVRVNQTPYPDDKLVADIERVLAPFLPEGTSPATRAALVARVNVSDVYNFTRFQIMTAPEMQGLVEAFIYSAILDSRTTQLCRGLAGRIFTKMELYKSGLVPPNHFNCRSMLLPVTQYDKGWRDVWERQGPLPDELAPYEGFG